MKTFKQHLSESTPITSYAQFALVQEQRERLEASLGFSRAINAITPDSVKSNPEWRTLKAREDRLFQQLRQLNATYASKFKKEAEAARDARRAKRLNESLTSIKITIFPTRDYESWLLCVEGIGTPFIIERAYKTPQEAETDALRHFPEEKYDVELVWQRTP